jgi:Formate hydrogenlyase subunit 3/Multisubunit Na+/H+ antiporter, MnhD subunit
MEELGGLARRMPLTWLAFVVGSAAIIGVPPLNGFVSEWLVFQTLFRAGFSADALRIAVLAVPGLALVGGLALACFVKVGGVVFLGTPRSSRSLSASKPGLLLDGPPLVLAAVCVFIGCLPVLVLPPMLIAGGFVAGVPLLPLEARAMAAAVGAREISIMAAVLALTAAAIWLIAQGLRRTVPVRQSETWGCGYPLPSARMQYTASSFAAPLLEIFGKLSGVRAHRGASVFHSESVDLILDGAVVPWWAVIERAALRLRPLQQGRLSRYLMYVISTVVALLAYLLVRAGDR